MKTPLVYIIILNWNGLEDTLACLESVYNLDYPNFKVVVVDNGSTQILPDSVKKIYSKLVLIRNNKNIGYTGGNNVGMRYAIEHGAKYIWLLNNDTIIEQNCLSKIIDMAESSNDIGLVSPIIYYFENPTKVQFGGSYIDWKQFHLIFPPSCVEISSEFQTGKDVCLWGTALLIKRIVIEKIGYLKDEYFAYWEDTDFSIRSLRNGFRNIVCKSARIYHKTKIISEGLEKRGAHFYYFIQRNHLFLMNERFRGIGGQIRFILEALAEASVYAKRCPKEFVDVSLTGAWHGIKNLSGPYRSEPPMPRLLKKIVLGISMFHPIFIVRLLTLDFRSIHRKFTVKK